MQTWTEVDYEQMGWHDNYIHGFAIKEGEHGTGLLILDIDYILEWKCPKNEPWEWLVAPATLIFNSVTDLQLRLDYAAPRAAMSPICIRQIVRTVKEYPNGYSTYEWQIGINWPDGEVRFVASGYTQTLRSDPGWIREQCLTAQQRTPV